METLATGIPAFAVAITAADGHRARGEAWFVIYGILDHCTNVALGMNGIGDELLAELLAESITGYVSRHSEPPFVGGS